MHKYFTLLIIALASSLMVTTLIANNAAVIRESEVLSALNSHAATPIDFDKAVNLINRRKLHYGPTFWVEVINNPSYPAWQRRKCMYQFFLRNAQHTELSQLVALPGFTHWFKRRDVTWETTSPAMPKPFDGSIHLEDDYHALSPELPKGNKSSIYVRLRGRFEPRHFDNFNTADPRGKFLRAITGIGKADGIYIEDVAIDDRP